MNESPRLLIILFVGCVLVRAQDDGPPKTVARYDNYHLFQLMLGSAKQELMFADLEKISDSYMFFSDYRPNLSDNVTVLVAAHKTAEFRDLINRYHVPFTVISSNYQDEIDRSYASVNNGDASEMDWEHYYSRKDINIWMKSLADTYPERVEMINLGRSHEGRPIRGVKLTSDPHRSTIFIEAGICGSDWISTSTANFILNELLTSDDPLIKDMASTFNWIIVPIVNPDGYVYSFEKDRLWRKSRQQLSEGMCVGIDLNRNFGFGWNGTVPRYEPCHTNYAGDREVSAPETQGLTKYILEHRNTSHIDTYISLHGHSERTTFPYDDNDLREYNGDLLPFNPYGADYIGNGLYDGQYFQSPSLSGSSVDWAHAIAGIPSTLSIDLRGPRENTEMSILPADEIRSVGAETVDAILGIVRRSEIPSLYDNQPRFVR